ncbi:hypothetical protein ABBQ38_012834 [Trebouxia sp. C0009 RCD-2024]
MNAGRLVYKTILQINKQYSSSRLPLTGIVGFSQSRFRYPVSQAVKEAFNAQRDNPDLDYEDLDASPLRDLHEASQAAHAIGVPLDTSVVAGWANLNRKLHLLAEEVRQAAPTGLFDVALYPKHTPSSGTHMEQLQCITKTMFHKGRFRQEPYEWVYDGLKPLDIVDVVYTNKGISLTLAVTFLGIARHLGIPMSMVPIPEAPVPEVVTPANIKRRQATQTKATAPEPAAWLLRTEWPAQLAADACQDPTLQLPGADSSLPPCFVNPLKASVMSQEECQKQNPHMRMDVPWLWDVSLISVLAEFARVAITAHQRRGESDAVAFWIYQLMALDTMAPEWQHVMPS